MKKERNELLSFLAGLAMLIAGLYILSQRVMVSTSWWSFGAFRLTGSLIFIPLIAGIIWLFATGSLGAKVLTGLGVAFIVVSVVLSVNIHLMAMTLFDWVILLILIFGGTGLLLRALFGNKEATTSVSSTSSASSAAEMKSELNSVDEELEMLKNKMNTTK